MGDRAGSDLAEIERLDDSNRSTFYGSETKLAGSEGAFLSDVETRMIGKIPIAQEPQQVNRAHFNTQDAGDVQQAVATPDIAYPAGGHRR